MVSLADDVRAVAWALVLGSSFLSAEASAQCAAKRSTCSGCHDGARGAVPSHDPWHDDHAFADLCPTCHGGHGDALDMASAHENLTDPLAHENETCGACHGADTSRYVNGYRDVRRADAGATAARAPAGSSPSRAHGERGPNEALSILVAAVGALGVVVVALREHDRKRPTKQGVL